MSDVRSATAALDQPFPPPSQPKIDPLERYFCAHGNSVTIAGIVFGKKDFEAWAKQDRSEEFLQTWFANAGGQGELKTRAFLRRLEKVALRRQGKRRFRMALDATLLVAGYAAPSVEKSRPRSAKPNTTLPPLETPKPTPPSPAPAQELGGRFVAAIESFVVSHPQADEQRLNAFAKALAKDLLALRPRQQSASVMIKRVCDFLKSYARTTIGDVNDPRYAICKHVYGEIGSALIRRRESEEREERLLKMQEKDGFFGQKAFRLSLDLVKMADADEPWAHASTFGVSGKRLAEGFISLLETANSAVASLHSLWKSERGER